MERTLLGTSMPTACRPGMGATMRTLGAARRRAMLSARLAILETRTPGAGKTSNSVMTGPLRMPVTSASMLNSFSASVRMRDARLVSSSMIQYSLSPRFFSTSCTGMPYARVPPALLRKGKLFLRRSGGDDHRRGPRPLREGGDGRWLGCGRLLFIIGNRVDRFRCGWFRCRAFRHRLSLFLRLRRGGLDGGRDGGFGLVGLRCEGQRKGAGARPGRLRGARAVRQGEEEDRLQRQEEEQEQGGRHHPEGIGEELGKERAGPGDDVQEDAQREKGDDGEHEKHGGAPAKHAAEEKSDPREEIEGHQEPRPGESLEEEPADRGARAGESCQVEHHGGRAEHREKEQRADDAEKRRSDPPAECDHQTPLLAYRPPGRGGECNPRHGHAAGPAVFYMERFGSRRETQ